MASNPHEALLQRCLSLAGDHITHAQGGPFAALVVKEGQVIAEAYNQVTGSNDPTAHAEILAIRAACRVLGSHQLDGCVIYSSCEPCPMCLGAVFWARAQAVYFAATRQQAAAAGFDDEFVYAQIGVEGSARKIPFNHISLHNANAPFAAWALSTTKKTY